MAQRLEAHRKDHSDALMTLAKSGDGKRSKAGVVFTYGDSQLLEVTAYKAHFDRRKHLMAELAQRIPRPMRAGSAGG